MLCIEYTIVQRVRFMEYRLPLNLNNYLNTWFPSPVRMEEKLPKRMKET